MTNQHQTQYYIYNTMLAVLICSMLCTQCLASYVQRTFQAEDSSKFYHMVMDSDTGKMYVGATNQVYQLRADLTKEHNYTTGPQLDSATCYLDTETCPKPPAIQTDSIPMGMALDKTNNKLIVCSNLRHGLCQKYSRQDVSQRDAEIKVPIVPREISKSVKLLIAPGYSPTVNPNNVLYIASAPIQGVYKANVLLLSSRSLTDFSIVYEDLVDSTSRKVKDQQNIHLFHIKHIYAFSHEGFTYFITIQNVDITLQTSYVTKIIRVCQQDRFYRTYTEIKLECNRSGMVYNLAQTAYVNEASYDLAVNLGLPVDHKFLYVMFSKSRPNSNISTSNVAMCVYSMREIREKFTQTIQTCFKGTGNTGPGHVTAISRCKVTTVQITNSYCAQTPTPGIKNYPVTSMTALQKAPSIELTGNIPTSIAVAVTPASAPNYTVAFVGTASGHLLKIVVEYRNDSWRETGIYEDLTIEQGSAILSDMEFDPSKEHLYVMTQNNLRKVKVQDCSRHRMCEVCLKAKDPYCGWCPLESKCSMKRDCQQRNEPKGWLSFKSTECTLIKSVAPQQVQIAKIETVYVTIKNLPTVSQGYTCVFKMGSFRRNSPATRTVTGVSCSTPPPNSLPGIPTGSDHIVMKLTISANNNQMLQDIVSTNFTFFDCDKHKTCTQCTDTTFKCSWCIMAHKCTNKPEDCHQESNSIITAKNVHPSDKAGPSFCPMINRTNKEILVHSGDRKTVSVDAYNLLNVMKTSLSCVFKFPLSDQTSTGVFSNGRINCQQPILFEYPEASQSQNVPLIISWQRSDNSRKAIDNPYNIQVRIYKCTEMATDCGTCLTMKSKYMCGWCQQQGRGSAHGCKIRTRCFTSGYLWLPRTSVCPNPSITWFSPLTGPKDGGTNVTIIGTNLGKTYSDIRNKVLVAGVKCNPYEAEYLSATRIVCKTGSNSLANNKGIIQVTVSDQLSDTFSYLAKSSQEFSYVVPAVLNFKPSKGPQSGGTNLTLIGRYLSSGTTISVEVNSQPCQIISQSQDGKSLSCLTPKIPNQLSTSLPFYKTIRLWFDNYQFDVSNGFQYVKDPEITRVQPEKGIIGGGIELDVTGNGFTSIQNPKIFINISGATFSQTCIVTNDTHMMCKSPNLTNARINVNTANTLTYGFMMDDVESLRQRQTKFNIFPNPIFYNFTDGTKSFQRGSQYLIINGKNLNLAMQNRDILVKIGESMCNVTSIASEQLTCETPSDLSFGKVQPLVTVMVGGGEAQMIGRLSFSQLPADDGISEDTILYIGIGAGISGFVLLVIILVIIIKYRKKSKENDLVMKRMQTQMDVLECRVAKECKEAFAELQTDMTEITSDLGGISGIPFHNYRSFCMRVLFPSMDENDHPVMKESQSSYDRPEFDKGIRLFGQLIGNKTFLLLFIRTLESNKYFSMRDRVNVASLISVALQSRMEYHTDILKTLLAELIEKSVEGRNHPKLLLRRTESVAEKMLTNWFTFLLYKFLKECAGEPLFMLFRAIKQQVEKGPIDAMTGEARYSLSEDKLIRQTIDFKVLTLNVLDMDIQYGNQMHPVKVLDCDTVSQAKDKILDAIYKNAPYSSRPIKEELDLEWRTGETARIILQDDDITTVAEGEWKRLNTLAHYKVPDGAVMTFIPRQYNTTLMSDKSYTGSLKYTPLSSQRYVNVGLGTRTPPMSRTASPGSVHIEMEDRNAKFMRYHLVKQHDTEREKEGDRGSKMVSEIYLTRLLTTKGTLQQFVDDLFETIFSIAHRGSALPLAIKYMFDFLDDQALHHGITDQEVVHTWKSNSLPLRFWVNVIKNPNFVFNIHKSNILDSCLSVVAQTFMDSCSMSEHRLSKDSPSSKLLYAKEIPKYKTWVERYYQDIKLMPAISDQDMNAMLAEESRLHQMDFNMNASVHELFQYAVKYNDQLLQALDEDEFARKNKLAYKLEQVHACIENSQVV